MNLLLGKLSRNLFFTGKGGVGKTSVSCAAAIALSERGRRVLLVSTDPASNLDEILGVKLGPRPTPIPAVTGLSAMNIDPLAAARGFRERVVGPYRGVLPDAAVRSIEEQLSGACTTEIAAFDEFSVLLGDPSTTEVFDHVIFDTAPTGHTLRLLQLPAAWSVFLSSTGGDASCLGPLSGLQKQRDLYLATLRTLSDPAATAIVLVSRPDRAALAEADRTRGELASLGVSNLQLVLNGIFKAKDAGDDVARAMEARGYAELAAMPGPLAFLPRTEVSLKPFELVGIDALRAFWGPNGDRMPAVRAVPVHLPPSLEGLLPGIARAGRGVIMTMGKGGVGKTSVATAIAAELARLGHPVHLTTTDPAGRTDMSVEEHVPGLRVSRIDPTAVTRDYKEEVLSQAGKGLDEQGLKLLQENLSSPCTEEIAVFRAFASRVEEGQNGFVVLDTAPTGHTLLLLDATEAYHREVMHTLSGIPEAVRHLLPRLRDPEFTKILIVTLPEATPVHEAAELQKDLVRAGIQPYAWVINQSLAPLILNDPVLSSKQTSEQAYLREVQDVHATRTVLVPWLEASPADSGWMNGIPVMPMGPCQAVRSANGEWRSQER